MSFCQWNFYTCKINIRQHKCVVLVIVESALQPGDLEGGHVAEWTSEGGATASLDGGAGDSDVEYKLILFGPPPFM